MNVASILTDKQLVWLVTLVVGAIIFSIGVGGCTEANPTTISQDYRGWSSDAQIKHLEDLKAKEALTIRSDLALHYVYFPLLIGGGVFAIIGLIFLIQESGNASKD